jgi:hypothetical protein
MSFALAYLLLRRLVQLVAGPSTQLKSDVELVVLRHQLKILRRQVIRPRLRGRDRLFMAAIRALPRARWSSFVVSPQTLLRWHRDLVRGKWTYRGRAVGGNPPIPDEVRELFVRMGRDNPSGDASGSGASSPSSASGSRQRRSVRCCGGLDSARLLAVAAPPGASSLDPRLRGSWRLTSSPSRRSCSGRCTWCSRSRSGPAAFTSLASPGTQSRRGYPASPQAGSGGAASRRPVPDPGPGLEVLPVLR